MTGTIANTAMTTTPLTEECDIKSIATATEQNLSAVEERLTNLLVFLNGQIGSSEYPMLELPPVESFAIQIHNNNARSEHALKMLELISGILGV